MRLSLRSAFQSVLLLIASVIVALLLCEAGLRVVGFSYPSFFRPDDRLGLRLRPNAEGWARAEGEALIRINSAGFRDRERSQKKPADTFRVVVLGDSMIEAMQVDLEKTFVAQLETQLNACSAFGAKKIEVLNLGVSGYGTAQELLNFRYFGATYSPDLVLASFFAGNDVRNNSKALEPEKMRPFFELNGDMLVEDRSFAQSAEFQRRTNALRSALDRLSDLRVLQAAYFIKDRLATTGAPAAAAPAAMGGNEAGIDDAVYSEPATPQWIAAWALTERLFRQLRDEVQAAGAKLVIVSLSSGIQVHPDPAVRAQFTSGKNIADLFYPNHRIQKLAADLQVQSIVLGPAFQEAAERNKVFFHGFPNTRMGSGHWNEAGNRMAADVVAAAWCGNTTAVGQANDIRDGFAATLRR
jgi:hypothetical protein